MKKLIAVFFSLFLFAAVKAQTVDDVVSKFEEAIGGDGLSAIQSLQITSTLKFDMMNQNMSITITTIRDRAKFFRRQVSGIMGMGNSYTILTPGEGYTFTPAMRGFGGGGGDFGGGGGGGGDRVVVAGRAGPGGGPGGQGGQQAKPVQMDSVQLAANLFELDLAGPFAPLVHYASKGNKAELLGTAKVNKVDCFKVKLTLKTGQETTYYISSVDYLIVQSEAPAKVMMQQLGMAPMLAMMGAGGRDTQKLTMGYSEYKNFGGMKYPGKQKLQFGALDIELVNEKIKINEPIEQKWYLLD